MIGRKLFALRVLAVVSVAMAAGHLVQSWRDAGPETATNADVSATVPPTGLPQIDGITTVSAVSQGADPACALALDLTALAGAMVDLRLSAPCALGKAVVIRHSGLAFSARVGANGQLHVQFPAMETQALVAAYVGDSEVILEQITVADAAEYLRLAVQMPGYARFDLRAVEQDGHVYVAGNATTDGPHRIMRLGQGGAEDQIVSEVYSVALSDYEASDLTAELRITSQTCGKTLIAEIVTSRAGRAIETRREVAMPLCGTSGDILLLKNLLPDLTLATPE